MAIKSFFVALVFFAPLIGGAAVSNAETTALEFTSGAGSDFQQGSYSLGWRFTVNESISVTSLGFYDDEGNGLTESHAVGIFDADTCGVVTQGIVSPADPLIGLFRYHPVEPAALVAGKDYLIAAVTGGEDYRIGVTPLIVDPAITFKGFAIYGNTESTTTLRCPNGVSDPGTNGDFGPTFRFEDGIIGPTPTATPDDSSKRESAITLFCNRKGINLETADCFATVADQGAPPRISPEGVVEFAATGGFSPASGSCALLPTALSPGISSCEALFTIPSGFPIATKFPIEAIYTGSASLKVSATSHDLIVASCIGTPQKPCSGAVALNFPGIPELIDNVIAAIIECGTGAATAAKVMKVLPAESPENGDQCRGELEATIDLGEAFSDLTFAQWKSLEASIPPAEAKKDPLSGAIKNVGSKLTQEQYDSWHSSPGKAVPAAGVGAAIWQQFSDLSKRINRGQTDPTPNLKKILKLKATAGRRAKPAKKEKKVLLVFGQKRIAAKKESLTRVDLKLPKRARKLTEKLKAIGLTNLPIYFSVSAKIKKSQFTSKEEARVGLR